MTEFASLQERIGYTFRDSNLLRLALTHPSVAHEKGTVLEHNQRLEFLGDSVLGLVLTDELYQRFPGVSEGPLTKARAHLVNRRALAEMGRHFAIGGHLILSRGEELHGGRSRSSAVADAFEALIGAIYLDGGFEAARGFVLRCFQDALGEPTVIPNLENPKGELQEFLQADSVHAPVYHVVSASGPDHDRIFECVVTHQNRELGRGAGKSKKAAETEAALAALAKLREEQNPPLPDQGPA